MIIKIIKLFLAVLLLVSMTACGGGSSSKKPVDPQQVAINKIAAYADNGKRAPTVQDYATAGVSGVSEENIDQINVAIESLEREDADTQAEIQAIADEYGVVIPPDTIAPVITVLGEDPVNILIGTAYNDAGATADDDRDGNVAVTVSGSVDTSIVGTYMLYYAATDTAGNIARETRTVHVLPPDTTPPVITIVGDNPMMVYQGSIFNDPGVVVTDDRDAELGFIVTGNVDTSTIATYVLLCPCL